MQYKICADSRRSHRIVAPLRVLALVLGVVGNVLFDATVGWCKCMHFLFHYFSFLTEWETGDFESPMLYGPNVEWCMIRCGERYDTVQYGAGFIVLRKK